MAGPVACCIEKLFLFVTSYLRSPFHNIKSNLHGGRCGRHCRCLKRGMVVAATQEQRCKHCKASIVNIECIDAIYVDFRLPERYQSKVRRGQTAVLDIDALPGQRYTVQIQAIDPLIDANGRSVGIRGCINNWALQLRPGMFAQINAVFGVRENASVIPQEAIIPQGGKQFSSSCWTDRPRRPAPPGALRSRWSCTAPARSKLSRRHQQAPCRPATWTTSRKKALPHPQRAIPADSWLLCLNPGDPPPISHATR